MALSNIPFLLNFDSPNYYGHDTFPNRMYRRLHERHHDPLDLHTLGLIARLGAHAHTLSAKRHGDMVLSMDNEKNGFKVHMDVGLFQPNELSVKIVDDSIVVEGKHEEREDEHGYISRHFVRRYALPKGYDPDKVVSTLSSDGVLTVTAPKPEALNGGNERHIQIQQTGPSDLFIKSKPIVSGEQKSENEEK